jgi:hypothetical protein
MKKQIKIIPDKTIELSHGDKVDIYIDKWIVEFRFYCDGTGNIFELTKDELREMLK